MPRPHVAALVHDAWNQRVARRLTDRGWGTRIVPHIGYGSTMTLRVLGRVVMDRDGRNGTDDARRSPRAGDAIRDLDSATRWWRDFVSSPAMQVPVAVTIGERPVIAAWNTFVREEGTRRAVPGMATLYRELRAAHPDMPFVYLSTGSWNIAPNLGRFLRRHGYPSGPLLLTDWGPTNTGGPGSSTSGPRCIGWPGSSRTSSGCSSVTTANTTRGCMPSSRPPDPAASAPSRSVS